MRSYFKIFVLLVIFVTILLACSKDSSETTQDNSPPVLKDNVKIIDSAVLTLDLSPEKINAGIYEFAFTGSAPNISAGDVIVGDQGDGFLRRVTSSVIDGSTIKLQTTQGALTDAFKEGGFSFNLNMTEMQNRSVTDGFSYTIPSTPIYDEGPVSIVLNEGQVNFDPNWFFDFKCNSAGVSGFELSARNATLNGNFTAQITAAQAATLFDRSTSILPGARPYKKVFIYRVPAVLLGFPVIIPVKVVMELDLVLDYSASINAAITRQAKFSSANTFSLGINYANGQWNDINSFSTSNNFTLLNRTGNATATINLALTPKVSFKLYGAIGPYAEVGLLEELSGSVASPSLDWDIKADVWLRSKAGINDVTILGYNLEGYSKTWETSKLTYATPYKIEKVSEDNLNGSFGQLLSEGLKVRVVDNLNTIQSNVPVYFDVTSGGGSVVDDVVFTDENGIAQTGWILGGIGPQTVQVTAKKADGTPLLQAPLTFTANTSNTTIPTVTIGSQTWMSKNLDVTTYRNGDPIPQVTNPAIWSTLTTGAWCYYNNDPANGAIYGKLYNWYAVNDPRGLAPVGFHVPSFAEWNTLINFLDPNANFGATTNPQNSAGGKMKSTTLWNSPNTGATNSSGFSGLPGGAVGAQFSQLGEAGYWYSSTEGLLGQPWYYYLRNNNSSAHRNLATGYTSGLSVRCVKD